MVVSRGAPWTRDESVRYRLSEFSALDTRDILDLAVGDCMFICCVTTLLGLLHTKTRHGPQPDSRKDLNTAVSVSSQVDMYATCIGRGLEEKVRPLPILAQWLLGTYTLWGESFVGFMS